MIEIGIRLGRGQNNREHWTAKARRVKNERQAVANHLGWLKVTRPSLPCTVRLTRVSPGGQPMDDDNVIAACKAARDQLAEWLGVDDKRTDVVRYVYSQARGPWGLRIEFGKPTPGEVFESLEVAA